VNDVPPVCDYEGSDYQSRFWTHGGRAYEDGAERVALRRLLPARGERGGRLLEIGAGAGRLTGEYAGYDEVVLVDYSRTLLGEARARLGDGAEGGPHYTYVAANVYKLPFEPATFGAAVMVRVIHHMADVPRALAQIRAALAPGALFVLEFASKQHLKAIARWALRRQAWNPFAPEPVEFAELNFDFSPAWMRARLAEAGFTPGRRLTVSHFRAGLVKRLVPSGVLVALDSAAQLTGDLWQLTPSVFVRCTVPGAPRLRPRAVGGQPAAPLQFHCPECAAPLPVPVDDLFRCSACGRAWRYAGGLYDFREPAA